MEAHSSVLPWRVPWTEEPGGLQSIGSQKSQTQLKQLSTQLLFNVMLALLCNGTNQPYVCIYPFPLTLHFGTTPL